MEIYLTYVWKGANCISFIVENVRGCEGQCFTVKNDYGEVIANHVPFDEVISLYYRLGDGWDGTNKNKPLPGMSHAVDDRMYIPSAVYIERGEADIEGGIATISKVEVCNEHLTFVSFKEIPGKQYNYQYLLGIQDDLAEQYKGRIAHPDPDYLG